MPLHLKFVHGDRDLDHLILLNHCGHHVVYGLFFVITSVAEVSDDCCFLRFRPRVNVERLVAAKVFDA